MSVTASSEVDLVVPGPLLGERRAGGLVERDLQDAEPEQRALQAHRRQRRSGLLHELDERRLILRERGDVADLLAAHLLGEHRRRGLADRAAVAGEGDLLDRLAVVRKLEVHRHLVAAERVLTLGRRRRVGELAVAARALVVVEDDLAVEVVGHQLLKTSLTRTRPAARRSTSSGRLYREKIAWLVAGRPLRRYGGATQA